MTNNKPKRILVLTPRLPWPPIGGDKIRIYNIAKGLKEAGHELALLSLVEHKEQQELANAPELKQVFSSIQTVVLPKWMSYLSTLAGLLLGKSLQTSYYRSREFQTLVDKELATGEYGAALVHLTRMAPYVVSTKHQAPSTKRIYKVLEMTDAVSLNYQRNRESGAIDNFLGLVYRAEEHRAREYEKECIKKFDKTVVVSPVDKEYLLEQLKDRHSEGAERSEATEESRDLQQQRDSSSQAPQNDRNYDEKMVVIRHGVQDALVQDAPRAEYSKDTIVFVGNLRTHQNNDAVVYFLEHIYPLVKKQRPEAQLRIVGANPSGKVKSFSGKNGVEVTGRVDDVADYVVDAAVSVCPVRIGAGVQGKVLESAALGVPTVVSAQSAQALERLEHGEDILVAKGPVDFAQSVVRLMESDELNRKLAKNALQKVRQHYRYSEIAREYAEKLLTFDNV